MKKPWIVVFGNIKGGTGKSTLAVHMAVSFLYRNLRVASVDADGRQGTFSRYLENRNLYCQQAKKAFPVPTHLRLSPELHEDITASKEQLHTFLENTPADIFVIDTGGNDSLLSRYIHTLADVLVTPLNDSLIDLDVLVNIQANVADQKLALSTYATLIWEQRMKKASQQAGSIDWIIVRNRTHSVMSKNKAQMEKILQTLAKRIGFHLVGSFGERVIFRELFDSGLTLLDKEERQTFLSHVAARQELRVLSDAILSFKDKAEKKQNLA